MSSQEEGDQRTKATLNEKALKTVTGTAETIGVPDLRAANWCNCSASVRASQDNTKSPRRLTQSARRIFNFTQCDQEHDLMTTSLIDLLTPSGGSHESGRFYGVVMGIVTNNQDPSNMARVRVKFPWLSDDNESWWARLATPMAGAGRGSYFLPEVNDEVLIAFEHGDVRFPYVLGGLWNGQDAPPANNSDGQNNIRVIHSRSGILSGSMTRMGTRRSRS